MILSFLFSGYGDANRGAGVKLRALIYSSSFLFWSICEGEFFRIGEGT